VTHALIWAWLTAGRWGSDVTTVAGLSVVAFLATGVAI
jgi:hypothetical protein